MTGGIRYTRKKVGGRYDINVFGIRVNLVVCNKSILLTKCE